MSAAQLTQQICCGLLTLAASIEGGKTIVTVNLFLYGFLIICLRWLGTILMWLLQQQLTAASQLPAIKLIMR